MRITVFILVLFLSFAQNVLAQQWVENGFLETISVDLEFKKSTDSNFTLEQKDINSMLRSIAYTHQKPVESFILLGSL